MYGFRNSWQSVLTDFSFIFSFDVELLHPGFHKGRLFLEMLSSIGLDLSVSLSFTKSSYCPFPIDSMLFKEAFIAGSAVCFDTSEIRSVLSSSNELPSSSIIETRD